jgi:hypothetical protein
MLVVLCACAESKSIYRERREAIMKTPQPAKNKVIAALYLRLSRDEAARQESYSVVNQRRILTEYCEEHGFDIYDEYIDDCDRIEPTQETA